MEICQMALNCLMDMRAEQAGGLTGKLFQKKLGRCICMFMIF